MLPKSIKKHFVKYTFLRLGGLWLGVFCLLYPLVGHVVKMVLTNVQQKSVRVVHAHFVPICM